MKNLEPEQYRVLHQRIVRALSDERGQKLRTESKLIGAHYPAHVATSVLRPYISVAGAVPLKPASKSGARSNNND